MTDPALAVVAKALCRAGGTGLCVGFCHAPGRCSDAVKNYGEQAAWAIAAYEGCAKKGDNLPNLSVEKARDYVGLYYIAGAPFRISFWTHATGIDAAEGQRRLDFANALVTAWNNRGALDAERTKLRETLAGLLEHSEPIGVIGDHFAAEARAELDKDYIA